ncbi:hypothetical protein [Catenovulum agarivorans]|uniref:hypothetical protein n=1 Tax=Catenovulum agarivorans TaxID=1172192 RepID=UPI0002F5C91E|nr:hypothetical protein [Catenovulum agarivorans]
MIEKDSKRSIKGGFFILIFIYPENSELLNLAQRSIHFLMVLIGFASTVTAETNLKVMPSALFLQ